HVRAVGAHPVDLEPAGLGARKRDRAVADVSIRIGRTRARSGDAHHRDAGEHGTTKPHPATCLLSGRLRATLPELDTFDTRREAACSGPPLGIDAGATWG